MTSRRLGLRFLAIPDACDQDPPEPRGDIAQRVEALQRLDNQVDHDEIGYLPQIFAKGFRITR